MSMLNDDLVNVVIKSNLERKERQQRIIKKQEERKTRNRKRLQLILIMGVLAAGGFAHRDEIADFVTGIVTEFQTPEELQMGNLDKRIGSLVMEYDSDVPLYERKMNVSILSQCTKRTPDKQDYYYQHDLIAKKILELDPELREYALCAVLNNMGNDMYIKFDGAITNADELIRCIQVYEKDNEAQVIEDGINTLEDYLKHKGHVNKKGEVSFSDYKKSQDQNAQIIKEIIDEYRKSKGM